jgi:integrase
VVVDHQVHDSAPKTERGRRRLALDPVTLAALEVQRQLQAEDRQAVGRRYRDHGYVFTWPDGRPLHPENIANWFEQHTRAAGLPRVRLHDLRHSYATAALQAGISAKVISERLGHASVAFTLQTYGHVIPARTGTRPRPSRTSSSPARRRGPEPWSWTPPLTKPLTTARRATHLSRR